MDGRAIWRWGAGVDGGWVVTMLVALIGFAYALNGPLMLMDGDTGWHLATGRWMLAHGTVPTTDPFSYTAHGRPWVAHEWLSELAMYAAWWVAGWSGLIALTAAAFAASLVIVGLYLRRWLEGPGVLAALALLGLALTGTLIARPHMLALPLLAGWTVLLLCAREDDRAPSLGWAATMLVWANMHGSFLFGFLLTAVFALDALVAAPAARRWEVVRSWGTFGIVAGGAALLTPGGVYGFVYPLYVSRLALLPYIHEWLPLVPSEAVPFEIFLLVGFFALLARPTQVPSVRLLLLLATLHLSFQHMRQANVFVVVATLVAAAPIARGWNERTTARPLSSYRVIALVALLLALGLAATRIAHPIERADSGGVPASALRALPPELRSRRVFNEYSFGGALILAGIPAYIDGRSDMYGDAFSIDYFKVAKGDRRRWRAADRRWRFGWTILPPTNPLVPMLDADPAWRRTYADETGVIHVRR